MSYPDLKRLSIVRIRAPAKYTAYKGSEMKDAEVSSPSGTFWIDREDLLRGVKSYLAYFAGTLVCYCMTGE